MNESSVGLLLTSPLARAVETGELIRSGLPVSPPARTTENLSPGFRQKALLDEIVSSNAEAVIAVGHQPDMSGFLMWLITDARGLVEMPPCTTALVQLGPANAPDSAALRWLITPDLLRRQYPNDIRRSS
jgi:phosphohistidine phosphatase SixA